MQKQKIFITYLSNTEIGLKSSGGIITLIQDTIDYFISDCQEVFHVTNNQRREKYNKKLNYIKCTNFLKEIFKEFWSINQPKSKFLAFGCSRPWVYISVTFSLILKNKVYWHPSYHPAEFVDNKFMSKLAKLVIQSISNLAGQNLKIICQTNFEREALGIKRKNSIFGIMKNFHKAKNFSNENFTLQNFKKRKYKLTFVGRATKQKGWDKFLKIVSNLPKGEQGCAVIGKKYSQEIISAKRKYKNLLVFTEISEKKLLDILQDTMIFFLPSNYESLGISHIEAVLQGCFVPLFGRYPFWDNSNLNLKKDEIIFNSFLKNDNLYKEAYSNALTKISFLETEGLIDLFESTLRRIVED